MTITRRNFIQNLGAVTAAVVTLNSTGSIFASSSNPNELFLPSASLSDPLNYLKKAHFEPFINTSVRVQTVKKQIQLRLVEVKDLNSKTNLSRGFKGESFSLLFEDSRQSKLPQETYKIQHARLGEFALFLVPTGLKGNRYEAIINRINLANNK